MGRGSDWTLDLSDRIPVSENKDIAVRNVKISPAIEPNSRGILNWTLSLQPKEKRDFILKELLETESNYVEVLSMLRKHFIRPIVSIKEADKKIIFMNIKELGESHGGFHKEILDAVTGKSRKRVGEVFLEYKERFLKYGEYCAHLTRATHLLETLTSKEDQHH